MRQGEEQGVGVSMTGVSRCGGGAGVAPGGVLSRVQGLGRHMRSLETGI